LKIISLRVERRVDVAKVHTRGVCPETIEVDRSKTISPDTFRFYSWRKENREINDTRTILRGGGEENVLERHDRLKLAVKNLDDNFGRARRFGGLIMSIVKVQA
jgi:hypothetical protein